MTRSYIVANSFQNARVCAFDTGWAHVGQDTFMTPGREVVMWKRDSPGGWRGVERGTRIWFAWGCWHRQDEPELWRLIEDGRLTLCGRLYK